MEKQILAEIASFRENRHRFLGKLFSKSYRYMKALAAEYFSKLGYQNLRVGYVMTLVHIDADAVNINYLAQKTGMTKQGMSKMVKEMQAAGYLTVNKDASDARALAVSLTKEGLKVIHDWKNCSDYLQAHFTEILGAEKLEQLTDLLEILVNHADMVKSELNLDTIKNEYIVVPTK